MSGWCSPKSGRCPQEIRSSRRRGLGGSAGEVVLVAGVDATQVQFMIDQVFQDMLEGAGQHIPLEMEDNEAQAGVDGFLADHGSVCKSDLPKTLDIPIRSPQNAPMKRVLLQPR